MHAHRGALGLVCAYYIIFRLYDPAKRLLPKRVKVIKEKKSGLWKNLGESLFMSIML